MASRTDTLNPQYSGFFLPDFTAASLYRVFNRSSFNLGGRLYGGWWQMIPSVHRPKIMIDGYPTREIDFSSMQIAMLYAQAGHSMQGDAYELPGIEPNKNNRKAIKKIILSMINAESADGIPNPEGVTMPRPRSEIIRLAQEKHSAIESYFFSGEGTRLQRLDSDIAERVMVNMGKRGILVLPVHDSFIVPYSQIETVKEEMVQSYRAIVGGEIDTTLYQRRGVLTHDGFVPPGSVF